MGRNLGHTGGNQPGGRGRPSMQLDRRCVMRRLAVLAVICVAVVGMAGPAFACGGLIGRNGTVSLVRTTTLAGYHDGVEHYVTSFSFAGAGGAFGSIVPLPGIPAKVERGGNWTLQRLVRETTPVFATEGL